MSAGPEEPPSARLQAKLELAAPTFAAAAAQLWRPERARAIYPVYLATMHMIVRSAAPLLDAACAEARARLGDDPLAAPLVDYLGRHAREERGHDQWLLDDLAATGAEIADPRATIPSARVAALVGAQYYWLHHHHPVALLGHIAAIESYPPPPGFAARLRELTGYPAAAFRAIARHEILDIRHRREFYEFLDGLSLSRAHESVIGLSALHTMAAGVEVLLEIHERV